MLVIDDEESIREVLADMLMAKQQVAAALGKLGWTMYTPGGIGHPVWWCKAGIAGYFKWPEVVCMELLHFAESMNTNE